MLYFQFLQTVARFIIQAIKIDNNKDGKISRNEISTFFFTVVLPLITSGNQLKEQWQGFYDKIKGITLEEFKEALMDIVTNDLLPSEQAGVEEKIDLVAESIFDLIEAIEGVINAYQEIFNNKKLEIRVVDIKKKKKK